MNQPNKALYDLAFSDFSDTFTFPQNLPHIYFFLLIFVLYIDIDIQYMNLGRNE